MAELNESVRLFVAIPLPEPIKAEIEQVQSQLRRAGDFPGMRWTRREQFHLTLKFFGHVATASFEPLIEGVAAACAGFAPLELRAEKLGFFPGRGAPQVLWVGVNDCHKRLGQLQQEIEQRTKPFTNAEPEKRFTGHVTLARVKGLSREEAKQLKVAVAALSERRIGDWVSTEVAVMRSELTAAGARHECLRRVPLDLT